MKTVEEASRVFWQRMLVAGGHTALPRWSLMQERGVVEHEVALPRALVMALRHLAEELGISLDTALLAAHASVLAALSGEHEITTGYIAVQGGQALLCRLTTRCASWRSLLLDTYRVQMAVLAHRDFPVDAFRRELELKGPLFEAVFDPTGGPTGNLAEGIVLSVRMHWQHERDLVLRLQSPMDLLDAASVARIASYHLTALTLMVADPEAEPGRQSLLSGEEERFQVEGLAGRCQQLPDLRFHELFEQRVKAHPDAIAAVQGTGAWSYQELNARANRLGRALLARGLNREGVVAVVTERNLDWMAAVLAIFKAGGVYLPIEPHVPADRIASTLTRAGCQLVLTEHESCTRVEQALVQLTGVQMLFLGDAYEQERDERNLGVCVAPRQLAYIYFTSGSTGEPKGAMCEHAGMLNHLYAKIADLGISEGQVVAQTAPQSFDISLWQLVSVLLVGGRTLLVEQATILNVEQFVEQIIARAVAVFQVVPSYLEVVLSSLEQHPRHLPDLRGVSVTGEALKKELTLRWFALMPAIPLVNAYGLTETSDDATHEVMDRVPDRERVPLGHPINNVSISIVDEHLSLVPLGAPGEIVFSGICVGRGYVNDARRTQEVFLPDPRHKGQRLYRSGDYGRWLPEGKLEFLGRRDSQVKIAGFRIEIGEIEKTLLRIASVSNGAVVVVEDGKESKRLVAFYCGPQSLEGDDLRKQLSEWLPRYMLPSAYHWLSHLPLTSNGKIDRKRLVELAGAGGWQDNSEQSSGACVTATEHRLAHAWAQVLGIPQERIGRQDHFFDRGGTSLGAVKLAIILDRSVSLKDIINHPHLADLAQVIEKRSEQGTVPAEQPRPL